MAVFVPQDWERYKQFTVKDAAGVARRDEVVHGRFELTHGAQLKCPD